MTELFPEIHTDDQEHKLCLSIITAARSDGWKAYPEHERWDAVLVRRKLTIGVETKLAWTMSAIRQVAERRGVHYKLIIAPVPPSRRLAMECMSMSFDLGQADTAGPEAFLAGADGSTST